MDIQKLADDRSRSLDAYVPMATTEDGPGVSVLQDNAKQVLSDATTLLTTFEMELTNYTPETPADMLTQVLVLSDYYHGHALDEGSDAEAVVRLLIGRLLEGLVNMAGRESSPIFDGYFIASHTWAGRIAELKKPVTAKARPEPFVVRVN
jgi:hypothetical protein